MVIIVYVKMLRDTCTNHTLQGVFGEKIDIIIKTVKQL